jgi:Flp pilus assembly protein CpaB
VRRNRLIILFGILLAALAFVGIVFLLNQRPAAIEDTPGEEVLVATTEINVGDEITADMVEVREVDPQDVEGAGIGDESLVVGRVAHVNVPPGRPVSAEVIGQGGETPTDIVGQLQPGEKAIALQVDRVTGLDFLVRRGDNVDIVLGTEIRVLQPTADSLQNPDQPPRFETIPGLEAARTVKTVLQNKRVLYVSSTQLRTTTPGAQATPTPAAAPEGEAPEAVVERVVVVIAGSDADAELIKFAQRDAGELGTLTVVLRHPEDDAEEATEGVTIDALVERYGVPIPDIAERPEETGQ